MKSIATLLVWLLVMPTNALAFVQSENRSKVKNRIGGSESGWRTSEGGQRCYVLIRSGEMGSSRLNSHQGTGTTRYLLDGPTVLEELDAAGTAATSYLTHPHVIDEMLSIKQGVSTYYPLTDALGSVYAATDSTGAVVHRYDFDVYGVRTDLGGTAAAIDNGYTGKEHDANGLINNGKRQRNPLLGSWLQADPMGMVDGPNVYNYAGNQPTMATDPTGLFKTDFNSMNQVCGVALAGNWGRTFTFLQALEFAFLSSLGSGDPRIERISEYLVDGVGPLLEFDTGPGLIDGTMYAGTSVDITSYSVTRVLVSTQSIDRGIEFLAHVLVHEAAHVERFHHPELAKMMMNSSEINAALFGTARERGEWMTVNTDVAYEGYWAENQIFGKTNFVH